MEVIRKGDAERLKEPNDGLFNEDIHWFLDAVLCEQRSNHIRIDFGLGNGKRPTRQPDSLCLKIYVGARSGVLEIVPRAGIRGTPTPPRSGPGA